MPAWLVWLIVGAIFAAGEAMTGTFVLLMMAGGATGAAISAAAGGPLLLQVIVFILVTLLLMWLVRPIAMKHLTSLPPAITNAEGLVGREAVVLDAVSRDEGGRVRLNGAVWSARVHDPYQQLAAGTRVRVVAIDGATAIVAFDPSVPSY